MKTIVFIDSENPVRESYSQLLEAAGFRVFQATTAQYGMWLCAECDPNLIITTCDPIDAELEAGDFVDSLRRVAGRTPIVVVSHGDSNGSAAGDGVAQRYIELVDEIHRALDDGYAEVTLPGGRSAADAASS